jgi:hypothetical protein
MERGSVEHIVSESMGNSSYVLSENEVCGKCNNKFSSFENKALSQSIWGMERAHNGIVSKKGRNAKVSIGDISIEGDRNFEKQVITVAPRRKGKTLEFPVNEKGEFTMTLKAFDKVEEAAAKTLLKMGFGALYKSKRAIFDQFEMTELTNYILGKRNMRWYFYQRQGYLGDFKYIPEPKFNQRLVRNRILLQYLIIDDFLIFKFSYFAVTVYICLNSPGFHWIKELSPTFSNEEIFPKVVSKGIRKED